MSRLLETGGRRGTEGTTYRALESEGATPPAGDDVLLEPFNNYTFAPWTLTGTPTIVAGRNGTAASILGTTNRADYLFEAKQSDTIVIGFAWRTATTSVNVRDVVGLYNNTNTVLTGRIQYNGTTAQTLSYRDATGTVLGTSSTNLIPVNTWAYIELKVFVHTTAGTVVVRVNGNDVINLSGVNTKGAGDGIVDAVRLFPNATGITCLYDDLYITTGAGAAFKGDIVVP